MKMRAVGAELLNADGQKQTNMSNLIVAFRNFAKSIKTSGTGFGNKLILFKRHV